MASRPFSLPLPPICELSLFPPFDTQPQPRLHAASSPRCLPRRSLSTQIIYRGQRSAGYGFVAFNTLEAAQNAAELLNKKELDGRSVIVEIAKPAEEKQREKSEKKPIKRRPSKRVKPAAAAADAVAPAKDDADETSAAEKTEGEAKPKKKRTIVSSSRRYYPSHMSDIKPSFSATSPRRVGLLPPALPKATLLPLPSMASLLSLPLPKSARRGSQDSRRLPSLLGLLVKPL
jgi:hypothetical protein